MPFVEGESVRQRLERERQLPIPDSVRIATEVASALDYAHRRGVIHRDIKPENILLHDGSAIVADFGIALAITEAGGTRITQTGLSLGTPGYMSPEQASAERAITARSDIYSLGAVTYEMLAGEPPFTGPTAQAVIARVMTEEPRALSAQRKNVPPNVEAAVRRALEKVPADRFATAHEFADALANTTASWSSVGESGTRSRRDRRLLAAAAAITGFLLLTTLWGWMRPVPPKPHVVRYYLALDSAESMVPGASWWTRLAMSADGSTIAYIGGPKGELLIRRRDQLHAMTIPGTEGAVTPFFSPDGKHVGFLGERKILIASVDGGTPLTISDTLTGTAGASWAPDGNIYIDGEGEWIPLLRVAARANAAPQFFTALDSAHGEIDHTWPDVLPNGKGVLFTVTLKSKSSTTEQNSYSIAVADIPSGKHHTLIEGAKFARYSKAGFLLYVTTGGKLMAVPFDQNSLKITGDPTQLADGIRSGQLNATDLAVADDGTIIYGQAAADEGQQEFVWVGRDGKVQPVDASWRGRFWYPSLSPDGKLLAFTTYNPDQTADVWVKRLSDGNLSRLTTGGHTSFGSAWSPDGRTITFTSNLASPNTFDLWRKPADGSGQAVRVFHFDRTPFNPTWSPDSKWLVFGSDLGGPDKGDIFGLRPGIDSTPVRLVGTPAYREGLPSISPNGKWLAYFSDETGRVELYVAPFPNTQGARWQISSGGALDPSWSHKGTELFYRDFGGNFVAVDVKSEPTFVPGRSRILFSARDFVSGTQGVAVSVAPGDSRFLMIRPVTAPGRSDNMIVVENWPEEIKTRR